MAGWLNFMTISVVPCSSRYKRTLASFQNEYVSVVISEKSKLEISSSKLCAMLVHVLFVCLLVAATTGT